MSYNESLSPNSNYPAMSQSQWDSAPFNEPDVPEKEFDVTISQTLSKNTTVTTNDYIPGASGVDYEPDDEGGYCSCGWHDPDDTSDTNWNEAYKKEHYTPLDLIGLFKETLEQQLESWEGMDYMPYAKKEIKRIEHLIEECSSWIDDEIEICES